MALDRWRDTILSPSVDRESLGKLVRLERRRMGWSHRLVAGLTAGWCTALVAGALAWTWVPPIPGGKDVLGWAVLIHVGWIALAPALALAPCWAEDRHLGTLETLLLTPIDRAALVQYKLRARLLPWVGLMPVGTAALGVVVLDPAWPIATLLAMLVWGAGFSLVAVAATTLGNTVRYGWFGCVLFSLLCFSFLVALTWLPLLLLLVVGGRHAELLLLTHACLQLLIGHRALSSGAADLEAYFETATE